MNEQDIMNKLEAVERATIITIVDQFALLTLQYVWLPKGVYNFGDPCRDMDKLSSKLMDYSLTHIIRKITTNANSKGDTRIDIYVERCGKDCPNTNLTGEVVERLLNLAA